MSFPNVLQGKMNKWKPKSIHQLTKINQFPKDMELTEGITCNLGSFYTYNLKSADFKAKFKPNLAWWVL